MRRLLESLTPIFARLGRLRVVKDHVEPSEDYLLRHYILGGKDHDDKTGELIHRRVEVCLHKILRSDNDYLHNHPAAYASLILAGSYREHTPSGVFLRRPGHFRVRSKDSLHRLEVVDGPVWTAFVFLNRKPGTESDWGFLVGGRLVHQTVHLAPRPAA